MSMSDCTSNILDELNRRWFGGGVKSNVSSASTVVSTADPTNYYTPNPTLTQPNYYTTPPPPPPTYYAETVVTLVPSDLALLKRLLDMFKRVEASMSTSASPSAAMDEEEILSEAIEKAVRELSVPSGKDLDKTQWTEQKYLDAKKQAIKPFIA